MIKIIIILILSVSLMACAETWQGVKKDSEVIGKSINEAGAEVGKKIEEVFSSDDEKEGEK